MADGIKRVCIFNEGILHCENRDMGKLWWLASLVVYRGAIQRGFTVITILSSLSLIIWRYSTNLSFLSDWICESKTLSCSPKSSSSGSGVDTLDFFGVTP